MNNEAWEHYGNNKGSWDFYRTADKSWYAEERKRQKEEEERRIREERRAARLEASKRTDDERESDDLLANVGNLVKELPGRIASGIQQGVGAVADVSIMGGNILEDTEAAILGKSAEERAKIHRRYESLRDLLKEQKTVTGDDLVRQDDFQWTGDLGRDAADLAERSLNVSLGATQFMSPAAIAKGGVKSVGKTIARDAAVFGAVDGIVEGAGHFSDTGDLGGSIVEGGKAAITSAATQGALGAAGVGINKGSKKLDEKVFRKEKYRIEAEEKAAREKAEKEAKERQEVEAKKTEEERAIEAERVKILEDFAPHAEELPERYRNKLNTIQRSGMSGDKLKQVLEQLKVEGKKRKKFDTLGDGFTLRNKNLKQRMEGIDRRLDSLEDPEYQANNRLTRKADAEARYDEMTSNPEELPGYKEASANLADIEQQVEYYSNTRVSNPGMVRIDRIRDSIDEINQARQEDYDQLKAMADAGDIDEAAALEMAKERNLEYDKKVKAEQAKLDEIYESDPELEGEVQILDNVEQEMHFKMMQAKENVDKILSDQEASARTEYEKILKEPDQEAIRQHKNYLINQKDRLNKRLEWARELAEKPNKNLEQVEEELTYLKDGTHPLLVDGASRDTIFKKYLELSGEKHTEIAVEVKKQDPEIPRTPEEEEIVLSDALEQVKVVKMKNSAKLSRVWAQPSNWLRQAGFEKLADNRTDAIVKYNNFNHDHGEKMKAWMKMAKGNSSKDLFRAANGDKKVYDKLTPGGQKVVDEWQEYRKQLGKNMGLPQELLDKDYYIPHLFIHKNSQPKLLKVQMRLKKVRAELDGELDPTTRKRKETHLKKLHKEIEEMVGRDNLVDYQNFIKEKGDYDNRFLKKREGKEGYNESFWEATDAYANSANIKTNLEPVMEEFALAKQLTPEKGAQDYFQGEIEKMRGTKHHIDRKLDDHFNELTKDSPHAEILDNAGTKALRGFRAVTSFSHIAGSMTSIINTLAQTAMLPGSVNADGAVYGMIKATALSGKLAKNTMSGVDTADFIRMKRLGAFEGSSHILPEDTFNKYFNNVKKFSFAGITGADRYIRMSTFYGAELKGKRMGLEGSELDRYILERINEVNQNFSKLETPHAFRSQVAKTLGTLVTFAPGMIVRSAEIGASSLKGAKDIIAHTVKGEPITRKQFMEDVDKISKGLFTLVAIYGVGQVIGGVTGQDEVVPNPLNGDTYNSPALSFIFGSKYKSGLTGMFLTQSGDKYSENGDNISQMERQQQFMTETLPAFLIPYHSQTKRTLEGLDVNRKGYSETDDGGIRYLANPENNFQRAVFGQYSTEEGQEYIDEINKPGGGALGKRKSEAVKNAPDHLKEQYYTFFRETGKIVGRKEANAEVTELFQDDRAEAARKRAEEFNAEVDKKLRPLFRKYPDLDEELEDKLMSSVYITLNARSEKARMNSGG